MPRRSRRWQIELDQPRGWVDPLLRKLEDLKLPPPPYAKRQWVWDDRIFGYGAMLTERGKLSFVYQCRIGGQSRRFTFRGSDPGEARKWAANLALKSEAGTLAPTPTQPASYDQVTLRRAAHDFVRQRRPGKSGAELLACLENHAGSLLSRPIESLERHEMTRLADEVEAKIARQKGVPGTGRHGADAMVKALNAVGRWYQRRSKFTWPMVPSPLTRADRESRGRRLENHEIASVWRACAECGTFGRLVRFLMLTGLREREAAELRRSEVADGVIRLAAERVKTRNAFTLPLSAAAADILAASPDGEWFFPGQRDPSKPFRSFTHAKEALGRLTNTAPWRIHDLRHTAQTIMEEAGVLPHVVDQVLNHRTPGMRGRYGHHNWIVEKHDALERLATEVMRIVNH